MSDGIKNFAKRLRAMPIRLGREVAAKAAPALTGFAQTAFDAGQTVYGDARPAGVDGQLLTLHLSGKLQSAIKFVSIGTIVRAVLGVPYARYNIRFGILPRGGAVMPTAWSEHIADLVHAEALRALEG